MAGVAPTAPLTQGGIVHAIVGTLIEIGIAVIVALPLGIGTAVFITEVGGRFARVVRTVVEAMTALPDILAGLFIYTTLIIALGYQNSGFAAAMALSVMMLPIIARSSEVRAARRSRRPARSQPGPRGIALAHGMAGRPAHSALGPGDRADPRHRPRDR